jgi:class 3 adenylate cyclase
MFTDVVGSTSYFERYGDTAGLAMLGRHSQAVTEGVTNHEGRVIKNIGDSVMAEFPDAASAAEAGVEIQRRLLQLNATLPERERIQVRIGINTGSGFRHGNDLFGDVVNVAARITKHCGPAQILVSRSAHEALAGHGPLRFQSLGAQTFHGKEEKEEVFEMLWTDTQTYTALREKVNQAVEQGHLTYSSKPLDAMVKGAPAPAPTPTPASGSTAAPAMDFPAALTSRYALLGEAGRGGMGVVYKAHDLETGDVVALKILKPEIASNPTVLERFKNEVRLARKITHRNVCRTYEFGRADGTAYISMEYVDGESLRAVLNRFGGLPLTKTFAVAREICAGLEEAHRQGVIHRDLKPENVMLDRNFRSKLMDFGIARSLEISTGTTGSIIGTPEYMAPEQAQGQAVDARTDVYALGLILYECLTGTPAFSGDTPIAVALKQVQEPPPSLRASAPTVPAEVEGIIHRCLEKDPARRFQSVAELDAEISQLSPATTTPLPYRKSAAAAVVATRATAAVTRRSGWRVWLLAGLIPLVIQGGFLWAVWKAARLAISKPALGPNGTTIMRLSPSTAGPPTTAVFPVHPQPIPATEKPVANLIRPASTLPAASSTSTPFPPAAAASPSATATQGALSAPPSEAKSQNQAIAATSAAAQNVAPVRQPINLPQGNVAARPIFIVAGKYPRVIGANFGAQKLARLGVAEVHIQPIRQPTRYMVFVGPFVNPRQAATAGARLRRLGMTQVRLIRQSSQFGGPPTILVSAGVYPHVVGARLTAQHLWHMGLRGLHIRPIPARVTGYEVRIGPFHYWQQANMLASRLRNEGFPNLKMAEGR